MNNTSPWGDLFKIDEQQVTPKSILEEYARALERDTKEILKAHVLNDNTRDGLMATLEVIAPKLDGFTVSLVRVNYPPELFPARVNNMTAEGRTETRRSGGSVYYDPEPHFVTAPDELRSAVEGILGSEPVKRILHGLFASSRG